MATATARVTETETAKVSRATTATDIKIPEGNERLWQHLIGDTEPMPKEAALVLYCLRMNGDPGTQYQLERAISAGVSWPRVLEIVRWHGVLPSFRENILRYCPGKVPGSIRAQLQQEFHRCAAESLGYARELSRVFACLQQHGVPALAFKGPALAQQLQQKLSLRQCRDLDIFIGKSQFKEAVAALESAGYRAVWPQGENSPGIFQTDKHVLLVAGTGGFKVEIHWSLALPGSRFPVRFKDLWSRREQVSVLGRSIPIPTKEDMLLVLCYHAAEHCWGSLKWICDIAEFLRLYPNLNWQQVLTRARRWGCCRILLTGAALARDAIGVPLPEALEREARVDRTIGRIRRDVLRRFSAGALPPRCVERSLAHIRSRERLWDRLQLILQFIRLRLKPNARDREWFQLPDGFGSLYILVRIVRVACVRYNVSVIPLLKTLRSS
ncbi:MAG TPA: nucleotidyltransferase family protein [Bryobacteraceae bacterium]|nr:nucleotidyltransferase family protein [Bryobacteraceae bacterium]